MVVIQESVRSEGARLDAAFSRLENAIVQYASRAEEQARGQARVASGSELGNLRDEIKNLENKLAEAKEEISNSAIELVRLKEENATLRATVGKVETLLASSIKDIEEMVA